MSQELHRLLKERSRVGIMKWSTGGAISIGLHAAFGIFLFVTGMQGHRQPDEVKVTWVSLPAMASPGPAGGAAFQEEGAQGERVRRVEEVAPKVQEKAPAPKATPNVFGTKKTVPAKGTNPDASSIGKAPVASKGPKASPEPTPPPARGAAGGGSGGGLGASTGIPGLKATSGVQGGTGLIGDLDGDFPFVWYLQQVQGAITNNWNRMGGQGRVQIYFRIRRDGHIEGARIESPSGNASLDSAALLAVRRSDPLPRLPEGFDGGTLGVRFWFSYLGN